VEPAERAGRGDGEGSAPAELFVVEPARRLSASALWSLQRRWYERFGVDAWRTSTVPYHATNNAFLAGAYAEVILGFLRDCAAAGADPAEPVHVVELGAGCGRFGFLLLRALEARLARETRPGLPALRYVMTDFAASNLRFVREHDALRPFVARGLLDFAIFDATTDTELRLLGAGTTIGAGALGNPVVVIANYVFDSLPQDAFAIRDGALLETVVALRSDRPALDPEDPDPFRGVVTDTSERPAPSPVYPEPELERILRGYAGAPGAAALLFPVAALRCLRRLSDLSGGRLLLLTADKGEVDARLARAVGKSGISVHGSVSMPVDYHAVAEHFRHRGGRALTTSFRHTSLAVSAYVEGGHPTAHDETRIAFDRAVERAGPDDLFTLWRGIDPDTLPPEALLALLRLAQWDLDVLLTCLPRDRTRLRDAPASTRAELARAAHRAWEGYYHVGEPRDAAFELGLLLITLGDVEASLAFFERSRGLYGDDPRTLWNIGLCHAVAGRADEAATHLAEAARLDPAIDVEAGLQSKTPGG
jgi:hypothetical protein